MRVSKTLGKIKEEETARNDSNGAREPVTDVARQLKAKRQHEA
jgi:hypothetical protein